MYKIVSLCSLSASVDVSESLLYFIQISVRKATVAALQKLSGLTNRDQLMELLDELGVFEQSSSTTSKKLEEAHDLNKRNEVCIV